MSLRWRVAEKALRFTVLILVIQSLLVHGHQQTIQPARAREDIGILLASPLRSTALTTHSILSQRMVPRAEYQQRRVKMEDPHTEGRSAEVEFKLRRVQHHM